jgi:hypothetical protein
MARPRGKKTDLRISVGFDERTYGVLSAMAQKNDATIAWVIRRAVAEYVGSQQSDKEPELPLRRAVASSDERPR